MHHPTDKPEKAVHVRVLTTSGSYPEHGHEDVSPVEVVRDVLNRASTHLGLTDTSSWVARVKDREINTSLNYIQNDLHGSIKIDFHPREGGGG